MPALQRILVAIKDPHARTLPAVRKAAQIAAATGARLELFHALSDPVYLQFSAGQSVAAIQSAARSRCLGRLEAIARRLHRQGLQAEVAAEWDFPAHEAIVRHARRVGADFIVAEMHDGAHRLPGLLQLTDWELLRHSAVPLLLVRTRRAYRRPNVLAAVDPLHQYAKPSRLDERVLATAELVGTALGGQVHAVHARMRFGVPSTPAKEGDVADILKTDRAAEAAARQAFARTAGAHAVPRSRQHFVNDIPVDGILAAARRTHCAIAVLGAVSRSGIKRLFIGNTAEQLLGRLRCDLLIVKPSGFSSSIARARRGARISTLISQSMIS